MAFIIRLIQALFDPLSRALAPLADGFLRRALLGAGVSEAQVVLAGVGVHYYYRAASPPPRRSRRVRLISGLSRVILRRRYGQRATPILLIHGLGDNALTWTTALVLLAPGRDVYALDLPGYGLSGLPPEHPYASMDQMRDVLSAFLREVVRRPALVVGNSMGGWLAVRLAEAERGLVREIVLVNAGGAYLGGRPSWEPFREVVAMPDLKTTRRAIRQILGAVPAFFIYIGQRSIQDRFQRQVVRTFVERADERDFLTVAELHALGIPVSIIWGMRDTFLPEGSFEFFRDSLPDAPTLELRRCGHLPQRERPLLVARFLDAHAAHYDRVTV